MPAYKNESNNTWYCKFYYKDWQGNQKQKKKSGFSLKREAQEWERNFLDKQQGTPDMIFESLAALYLEDVKQRLKASTASAKAYAISSKFNPYFGKMKINEIKPQLIRKWQNQLLSKHSPSYARELSVRLSSIFNFAIKFYNLTENPVQKAGSIKNSSPRKIQFWTKTEFDTFMSIVTSPTYKALFLLLYYTGMRIGELLALTPSDFNFKEKTVSISKTYTNLTGGSVITSPKTPKSNRVIALPDFLCDAMTDYFTQLYGLDPTDRIFDFKVKNTVNFALDKYIKEAGVTRIRLHDLRHSHVSLLIELNFSPLLIAERLGHESIETTLNTYSHLYPNKQAELVSALEKLYS